MLDVRSVAFAVGIAITVTGCSSSRPDPPTWEMFARAVQEKDRERFAAMVPQIAALDDDDGFQNLEAAQYSIGVAYLAGELLPRDMGEAMKWLRRAADRGDAAAQVRLAGFYCEGVVVPKNFDECVTWLRRATEHGQPEALMALAVLHESGQGVPQDSREYVRLMRLAAEQGHAPAQLSLAEAYTSGDVLPVDWPEAYRWLAIAAANSPPEPPPGRVVEAGSIAAGYRQSITEAATIRDELEGRLSRADVAEGQRRAAEWRPRTWLELKAR